MLRCTRSTGQVHPAILRSNHSSTVLCLSSWRLSFALGLWSVVFLCWSTLQSMDDGSVAMFLKKIIVYPALPPCRSFTFRLLSASSSPSYLFPAAIPSWVLSAMNKSQPYLSWNKPLSPARYKYRIFSPTVPVEHAGNRPTILGCSNSAQLSSALPASILEQASLLKKRSPVKVIMIDEER